MAFQRSGPLEEGWGSIDFKGVASELSLAGCKVSSSFASHMLKRHSLFSTKPDNPILNPAPSPEPGHDLCHKAWNDTPLKCPASGRSELVVYYNFCQLASCRICNGTKFSRILSWRPLGAGGLAANAPAQNSTEACLPHKGDAQSCGGNLGKDQRRATPPERLCPRPGTPWQVSEVQTTQDVTSGCRTQALLRATAIRACHIGVGFQSC